MNSRPMAEQLTHYGIPGMKWGVRRDRLTSSYSKYKNGDQDGYIPGTDIKTTNYQKSIGYTAKESKDEFKFQLNEMLKEVSAIKKGINKGPDWLHDDLTASVMTKSEINEWLTEHNKYIMDSYNALLKELK